MRTSRSRQCAVIAALAVGTGALLASNPASAATGSATSGRGMPVAVEHTTSATAPTCSLSYHCYAQMRYEHWVADPTGSQLGTLGAGVNMMVECMGPTAPAKNFVTQELWVGTDGKTSDSWVEVGMTVGFDNSGAGKTGVRYFWADQRALGGYKERNITSIPAYFGNTRRLEIRGDGKTTWDVYIDANRVGQSTQNSAPSEGAEAGEEATHPDGPGVCQVQQISVLRMGQEVPRMDRYTPEGGRPASFSQPQHGW